MKTIRIRSWHEESDEQKVSSRDQHILGGEDTCFYNQSISIGLLYLTSLSNHTTLAWLYNINPEIWVRIDFKFLKFQKIQKSRQLFKFHEVLMIQLLYSSCDAATFTIFQDSVKSTGYLLDKLLEDDIIWQVIRSSGSSGLQKFKTRE